MSYGITDSGFVLKDYDAILAELQAAALTPEYFGPNQDISIYDPVGQFVSLMAYALADSWEALEDAYYSFYVDVAEGVSLDRVVSLGGMTRISAQRATVDLVASGTDGITLLAGDLIGQTAQSIQFTNIASGVVASGVVALTCRAVVAGSAGIVAANTITQMASPVSGITAINNPLASTGGKEIETDPELRQRYKDRGSYGGSSIQAIEAMLLEVSNVTRTVVVENATNSADGDGRPAHSIECVVAGTATDEDIATCIFNYKPAGIQSYGAKSYVVVDDNGDAHTISWTEPSEKMVNVVINVTSNASWDSASIIALKTRCIEIIGGVDTIGAESTEYIGLESGEDVLSWQIIANFDNIEGMDDVEVLLAWAPTTPTSLKKLAVDYDEIARCDTSYIEVNVS